MDRALMKLHKNALICAALCLCLFSSQAMAATPTFSQMLQSFSTTLPYLAKMVVGACYLMGYFFAFKTIYQLKQYGEMRTMMASNTDLRGPIVNLIVAAVFIYLPTAYHAALTTVFGYDSPLSYSGGQENWQQSVQVMVYIIQLIGLIAFIRGWILIAKAGSGGGQQPGMMGKGIIHMIGGILAINIIGTQHILATTFGFTNV